MTDEKPFICLDIDGEHFNTPTGILYGCRLSDPRRIRRARFGAWMDKHPRLGGYSMLLAGSVPYLGFIAICVFGPHILRDPPIPMTPEGIAVQEQFSNLSENDQALIAQDWQDKQAENYNPPDPGGYREGF